MIEFVGPAKAFQHLTDNLRLDNPAKTVTLCGYGYEDIFEPVIYHHRTGFDPNGGPACSRCADAADRIQNGPAGNGGCADETPQGPYQRVNRAVPGWQSRL